MRHAETESGASYAEDSLRPLTENGRNTQRLVGQNMRKLNIRPDVVLCSPRLRAQQTAEITVEELDVNLDCISHHSPTASADPPDLTGRSPSSRFDVASTTPAPSSSPSTPSNQSLDTLATNSGEKRSLAIETVQILDGGYAAGQLIDQLVKKCSEHSSDITILCVGHVPDMGIWMDDFLGASADPANKFKTSSFAHIVFQGESQVGVGELKGFYRADLPNQ